MSKVKRKICGVGLNDADYTVSNVNGKGAVCPYYRRWCNMINRCYNPRTLNSNPTYRSCYVDQRWLDSFMLFRAWMMLQEWEGMSLDKDLAGRDNLCYGPETCMFVPREVNQLIKEPPRNIVKTDDGGERELLPGVSMQGGMFGASVTQTFKKGQPVINLGLHLSEELAHRAWVAYMSQLAMQLSLKQTNPEVAQALLDYEF